MQLRDGEAHVWRAFLPVGLESYQGFLEIVDQEERARADRFVHEDHRVSFIVAHGLLRRLLARYLGGDATRLRFACAGNGKPVLAADANDVRFNLSHSGDVVLCAFARGREVGIDVEQFRADVACEEIARRFFASGEIESLLAVPAKEQLGEFFRCWTRKEAFIKAIGDGLSHSLQSFAVSLGRAENARLIHVEGDRGKAAGWTLKDIPVPENYAAAIVVSGCDCKISILDWNDSTRSMPAANDR